MLDFATTGAKDLDILYIKKAERINRLSVNANGPMKRPKANATGNNATLNISTISK